MDPSSHVSDVLEQEDVDTIVEVAKQYVDEELYSITAMPFLNHKRVRTDSLETTAAKMRKDPIGSEWPSSRQAIRMRELFAEMEDHLH